MKTIMYTLRSLSIFGIALSLMVMATSCEQKDYEPIMTAAPGGGTVSTYKAYTLGSAAGTTINGRVVFYKYSSSVTLVEVGLYNTASSATYTASVYQGKAIESSATVLKPLDAVSGTTGAFSSNKYFTINEAGFYDKLSALNANVKIMSGTTLVASGDIGLNATPVAQGQ
ncbi:hypothetical protein [Spirosoma sp. KNUC1025]|uniref:hypothetical protein n=1 Tax=Spirosoma sp. KNUC1025 TaxID=2894082 RepID=UPI0038642789|nr:hypothetical protein LN737_29225 [Spirosoma sp. KNUC1025]